MPSVLEEGVLGTKTIADLEECGCVSSFGDDVAQVHGLRIVVFLRLKGYVSELGT